MATGTKLVDIKVQFGFQYPPGRHPELPTAVEVASTPRNSSKKDRKVTIVSKGGSFSSSELPKQRATATTKQLSDMHARKDLASEDETTVRRISEFWMCNNKKCAQYLRGSC